MKVEFDIEQIRKFVKKGYNSVAARYVKSTLAHYDEQVKNNGTLDGASNAGCVYYQPDKNSTAMNCVNCGLPKMSHKI